HAISYDLSHKIVAGAVHYSTKETIASHGRTPIHWHACEEVVITLEGYGTFYLSDGHDPDLPGKHQETPIYPNSTFTMPVNSVHQEWNTHEAEDMHLIITISKPPLE
ncbi:hypothetical protein M758_1G193500, partial [Ceratodon purpureus]